VILAISALCLLVRADAAAQPTNKNVLLLFSTVKYSDEILDVVEQSIRSNVPGQVTFYDAYLDDLKENEDSYRESEAETFRRRYSGVKMDLVITSGAKALSFAMDYRDKMFPGTPIVCEGVSKSDLATLKIGPGVTGVTTPQGFRETVDLALRLEPDTKTVAVIAGVTPWDSQFLGVTHAALAPYRDKVSEIDLVEGPSCAGENRRAPASHHCPVPGTPAILKSARVRHVGSYPPGCAAPPDLFRLHKALH
jgi:hypothetical protein